MEESNVAGRGSVVDSPFSVDLQFPAIDIPSYVFSSGDTETRKGPLFFDAADPSRNFSIEEAEVVVKRFAKGLKNLGLQPDDKVLLYSSNQLYFPIVIWGVLAAGCVFTGASSTASAFELSHQLRDSEAKIVLASPPQLEVAREAAAKSSLSPDRVFAFTDLAPDAAAALPWPGQVRHWTDIWAPENEARSWRWESISTEEVARAKTAVLNYSSGTTGLPKGVELTHYNLVSNVEQIIFKRRRVADNDNGRARHARLVESGERWLAPLPMYHAFGQTYYSMVAPRVGAKVFIMGKFDLIKYLTYIDIYRITFINVVPTILQLLTRVPNPVRFNLSSLQMVGSGSAPLDVEVARNVEKSFLRPGVQIKQGWGMTETTCNVTGFSPDDPDDGRSIGWVNPGCRIRIVPVPDRDFGGLERQVGASVGELWVTGPNIMKGYWKRPDETADTIQEESGFRWLRTGDIGYVDGRGCVYIVDRIKELIKVKGLQVSPAELERALTAHPGVLEAAVVGVKLAGRDLPRAFVVRKDSSITAEALSDLIKSQFAPHKWLTGGIYFVTALPRTGSGKVIKRALPNPDNNRETKL